MSDKATKQDVRRVADMAQQLQMSKVEFLFANKRLLRERLELDGIIVCEKCLEEIAEELILAGIRSEFLEDICLGLEKARLKNIQRNLEKKGFMTGVEHAIRSLERADRVAKLFLADGRIVVGLFLMIYELPLRASRFRKIHPFYLLKAFFLTKEIFGHPQIAPLRLLELPIDLAFFFCLQVSLGRVEYIFCAECGQVYPIFHFEQQSGGSVRCPYCRALSEAGLEVLRRSLRTGYTTHIHSTKSASCSHK